MPMTPEQMQALRSVPLGAVPNRLPIAFALTGQRQTDACQVLDMTDARMSLLVNGKREASLQEAGKLARYFGCAIEDLFPAQVQAEVA
jgi:plasmid maintenance system antidote protein VapI